MAVLEFSLYVLNITNEGRQRNNMQCNY